MKMIFLSIAIICMMPTCAKSQQNLKTGINQSAEGHQSFATPSDLSPVLDILKNAHISGSLQFHGRCTTLSYPGFPEIPALRVPVENQGTPLRAIRQVFADVPRMRVTQSSNGSIRMVEDGMPQDILDLRIKTLSFKSSNSGGIYSANAALNVILSSPEMIMFMKAHNIDWPFGSNSASGIITNGNPKDLPNVSGEIHNIKVRQAMDYILKTFPGLWIYQNCPISNNRKRMIYLAFYQAEGD